MNWRYWFGVDLPPKPPTESERELLREIYHAVDLLREISTDLAEINANTRAMLDELDARKVTRRYKCLTCHGRGRKQTTTVFPGNGSTGPDATGGCNVTQIACPDCGGAGWREFAGLPYDQQGFAGRREGPLPAEARAWLNDLRQGPSDPSEDKENRP